jgi:2-polyprenyl-6-hydroxyphenyl methylase/3-demethylubiquinone-9 3-methyltransferase
MKWLLLGNSGRYRTEKPKEFGHISILSSWVLTSLLNRAGLKVCRQGKSRALQFGHLIFPKFKFGRWLSFVEIYELRRKD